MNTPQLKWVEINNVFGTTFYRFKVDEAYVELWPSPSGGWSLKSWGFLNRMPKTVLRTDLATAQKTAVQLMITKLEETIHYRQEAVKSLRSSL